MKSGLSLKLSTYLNQENIFPFSVPVVLITTKRSDAYFVDYYIIFTYLFIYLLLL